MIQINSAGIPQSDGGISAPEIDIAAAYPVYRGGKWVESDSTYYAELGNIPVVLTDSELKRIGQVYNGYQVPLDEEAQIAVTSVAVQYLAGLFSGTVFHFSNGVKMPCSTAEFLPFATWFATERNKFFVEVSA